MKNLRKICLVVIVFLLAQNVEAQFLKKLAKHAEDKIEREAERRAERKVDEKIDDGFDKVEDEIEKDRPQKANSQKHKKQNKKTVDTNQTKVMEDDFKLATSFPTKELKAGTFSANPYPVASSTNRKLKRYDIKSGIVLYEKTIAGKVLTSRIEGAGATAIYFKDWGAVELNEEVVNQTTSTNFFGKKSTETSHTHTMSRIDNGEVYVVNFDQKSIFLRRDPGMDMMRETDTDAGDVGERMLVSMGGKKVGTEQFLGYSCDVWEIMGGKQWIYKGVVLKLDIMVMGIRTVQVATSARFNISVPEKYFRLPNYSLKKMDGYLDNDAYEKEREQNMEASDKLSKMTYPEFKRMAKNDPEMKDMSDKELHENFEMMKKMTKAMNGQ